MFLGTSRTCWCTCSLAVHSEYCFGVAVAVVLVLAWAGLAGAVVVAAVFVA